MEEWKDIKDYEGYYQVSNYGRVKSLHGGMEKILKQSNDRYGYPQVCLTVMYKRKTKPVHKLVAMAFLDHIPNGFNEIVDHIDNNPLNNNANNLQLTNNRHNCSKDRTGKSKYTGVDLHKSGKWRARIRVNGKRLNLGCFDCELAAAQAYNNKLKEIQNGKL